MNCNLITGPRATGPHCLGALGRRLYATAVDQLRFPDVPTLPIAILFELQMPTSNRICYRLFFIVRGEQYVTMLCSQ